MYWMIEADKLDVEQRHFIFEEVKSRKNLWIKGFAGSGKSVLLVHAVAEKRRENPNATICVVVFTHSLIAMFKKGLEDLNIRNVEVITYYKFYEKTTPYDYVYCDEVQDLTERVLENMKMRSNQLIVAGDSNQSIYDLDPKFKERTILANEIETITGSKAYELNTIYRLTKSIIGVVSALIPEMNILKGKVDRTKQDVNIRLCEGKDKGIESTYILKKAEEAMNIGESVVVILPTHNDVQTFTHNLLINKNKKPWNVKLNNWRKPDYNDLNYYLSTCGINMEYLGSGNGCLRKDKIIIMTYHSVKGLDFDNVFLPFLSTASGVRNKTLLMVGITRSKKDLWITYSGRKHEYIEMIKNKCVEIKIDDIEKNIEDEFDF